MQVDVRFELMRAYELFDFLVAQQQLILVVEDGHRVWNFINDGR